MRAMTDEQEHVLTRLIRIAGSPLLVQEAHMKVNGSSAGATLGGVLDYILENRAGWHARTRSARDTRDGRRSPSDR